MTFHSNDRLIITWLFYSVSNRFNILENWPLKYDNFWSCVGDQMTPIWPGLTPELKIFDDFLKYLGSEFWNSNSRRWKHPFLTPNKVQTIINNPLTCPQRYNFVNSPSPFIPSVNPSLYTVDNHLQSRDNQGGDTEKLDKIPKVTWSSLVTHLAPG